MLRTQHPDPAHPKMWASLKVASRYHFLPLVSSCLDTVEHPKRHKTTQNAQKTQKKKHPKTPQNTPKHTKTSKTDQSTQIWSEKSKSWLHGLPRTSHGLPRISHGFPSALRGLPTDFHGFSTDFPKIPWISRIFCGEYFRKFRKNTKFHHFCWIFRKLCFLQN